LPDGYLHESIEGVYRGEKTEGCADVRGDERGVRKNGRIEDEERHRDQAGDAAKHLASRQEQQDSKRSGEHQHRHVNAEEQRVSAVVTAILRVVAEE
jgi:hypothetical protein